MSGLQQSMLKAHGAHHPGGAFSRWFLRMLDIALSSSRFVISVTASLFVLSVVSLRFVPQQFFPKSDRPELLVDLTLP